MKGRSVKKSGMNLPCGVEILSYSLVTRGEETSIDMMSRSIRIENSPVAYDPEVDLVEKDLKELPGVLLKVGR